MGQNLLVLADRLVVVRALGPAHSTGVKPIVGPYSDGHEAEGAERARRGHQHHHTPVAHPHLVQLKRFPSDSKHSENSWFCEVCPPS